MGAGVVVLREGFEAALVVGIVLAFLDRSGRRDRFLAVWAGALAALLVSAAVGTGLFLVGAELKGRAEAAWEGTTMLVAAALLTWMIFWMRRQARSIRRELEERVSSALATGSTLALVLVVFVGVLREGVETALFLFGTVAGTNALVQTTGALIGAVVATMLGYAFYKGASRLNLRWFFSATSVVLLVFAGYLLARGLGELSDAGLLPESRSLVVAGFLVLALPTLALFLRPQRAGAS
ncbi:MAG: FTR1 family iron permease [Gaiellaceae bacterium]